MCGDVVSGGMPLTDNGTGGCGLRVAWALGRASTIFSLHDVIFSLHDVTHKVRRHGSLYPVYTLGVAQNKEWLLYLRSEMRNPYYGWKVVSACYSIDRQGSRAAEPIDGTEA